MERRKGSWPRGQGLPRTHHMTLSKSQNSQTHFREAIILCRVGENFIVHSSASRNWVEFVCVAGVVQAPG
jgi:hypothetical protein